MFNDNESLKAEVAGYPITARAWQLIAHACALTNDRAAAIDAMAADIRSLEASGDLAHAAVVLAMVAAKAMGHDELAAEQVMRAAETTGEFAAIVSECARQLAAEDATPDDFA